MRYKVIEVFTSEDAKHGGKPLREAIMEHVRRSRIAARCMVHRGMAACYEDGEFATQRIEVLSYRMPLKIEIVLPAAEADLLLPTLQEMVEDGVIGVRDLDVLVHRTRKRLLPAHLLARDVMTPSPKTVSPGTSAADVARLLLFSSFNAVPVVDANAHSIGVITQGDLLSRAGLPIRLGLLEGLGAEHLDGVLQPLLSLRADAIMTRPAVTVAEDAPVGVVVDLMLARGVKRLPVVDESGRITGILARVDLFRAITAEVDPAAPCQTVMPGPTGTVRDIMRRDTHTVAASAALEEVMRVIDANDIQRVAVVDEAGRLAGLITDRDLLQLFASHEPGVWDRVASKFSFTSMGKRHKALVELARKHTAGDVMKTDLITVTEGTSIEEAIRLMTQHRIKRLPVITPEGAFAGMISRDSVLRASAPVPPV